MYKVIFPSTKHASIAAVAAAPVLHHNFESLNCKLIRCKSAVVKSKHMGPKIAK